MQQLKAVHVMSHRQKHSNILLILYYAIAYIAHMVKLVVCHRYDDPCLCVRILGALLLASGYVWFLPYLPVQVAIYSSSHFCPFVVSGGPKNLPIDLIDLCVGNPHELMSQWGVIQR